MYPESTASITWETIQNMSAGSFRSEIVGICSLLFFVFLFIYLIRRQPKKIKAYSTDNGQVIVGRGAIVELVQTACEQLQDVSKPKVKIVVKRGVTNLDVEIKLLSGGRLRMIENTLQNHLRSALSENLGIENLGYINIIATGFKSGRITTASSKKQPEDPTVDAFEDASDDCPKPLESNSD